MRRSVITLVAFAATLVVPMFAAQADEVQDLADRWAAAYNAHNRAALGALYATDAKLMMHGEPTIVGRKDIEEFWAKDFKVGDPLTVLKVTNSVDGVDMVLVHGNYQVIQRDTGKILGFGRFAHIWMKGEGNKWQLDRDLWNQPYEEAAAAE